MAKATFTTTSGTAVHLEGEPSEVAALLKLMGQVSEPQASQSKRARVSGQPAKATLGSLLGELIDGGFFKKPRELSSIRLALEESGHFYPVTTLSPALLRLVRSKQLRRIKDNKRWLYVN